MSALKNPSKSVVNLFDPDSRVKQQASKISCISCHSMYRSCRVLREFVLYYFPLYNLSMQDFFKFSPILGFIEALVYETDEEVEQIQSNGYRANQSSPWEAKKKIILSVLDEHNLRHFKVESHLNKLGEYFELESQLLMTTHITHSLITQAAELRSSDYRVLHCTLLKMLGLNYTQEELNEELSLMWPMEVLNDMEDDLMSYQEDVETNHYNTYRMFVKVYGEKAPYYLKQDLHYYEHLFHQQLDQLSEARKARFSKAWNAYRLDHPVPAIPEPVLES
ncbi:hypothetical protein [Limnofasciculus baicalensis]|uniref:Uncharacterized protein n=1 Tax=Limnofasciculus baicalensis BBK-W-15 TaxID=2699891 RepID=A0AAE3KKH6_9CYAN|nr:hypothetical protein [Limnofasciculus baicalensis]MCP2727560.1 hypothetical protein [Limnofasciculus baicalensis BBK-W-15]